MSERPSISAADLPPAVRKRLGVKGRRRRQQMPMDQVRSLALRVLYVIADLSPRERGRVLRHALKVNDV